MPGPQAPKSLRIAAGKGRQQFSVRRLRLRFAARLFSLVPFELVEFSAHGLSRLPPADDGRWQGRNNTRIRQIPELHVAIGQHLINHDGPIYRDSRKSPAISFDRTLQEGVRVLAVSG
jgi:hypothetical protein